MFQQTKAMKTVTKKFPIYAGMQFSGGANKTINNRLHKVGTYTMQFTFKVYPDGDEQLVSEKEISRKFF